MPGRGSYGPGGKWVYERAKHLRKKNPDMEEGTSFAIATQQAHKLGKSPKSHRTMEGMRTAKQKYDRPLSAYRKTASVGWVGDIEGKTEDNKLFRKVLFTGKHSQLVLMSIPVGGDIGKETHAAVDQFFRIDGGKGVVIMNGERHPVEDGDAFVVPAGTKHNVINTSEDEPLQLYSVYSPPNHQQGVIHETKEDAMQAEEQGTDPKPKMKDIVPGKLKMANGDEEGSPMSPTSTDEPGESKEEKEEEEAEADPKKKLPKALLLEFFRRNPAPVDDQVHELSESQGASPHTVETQIYKLLGERLKEERMEKGAMLYGFFDELEKISQDPLGVSQLGAGDLGMGKPQTASSLGISPSLGASDLGMGPSAGPGAAGEGAAPPPPPPTSTPPATASAPSGPQPGSLIGSGRIMGTGTLGK